jgi:hypothetical protein
MQKVSKEQYAEAVIKFVDLARRPQGVGEAAQVALSPMCRKLTNLRMFL